MAEKKKKMISVTFTGKELLGNMVFDTTDAKVAQENHILEQNKKYGPLSIIIGENELLEKVEKEFAMMSEGETRTIKLLAKEAFGERNNDKVRVVALKNFFDQKINPCPGLVVRVGNAFGKVQSVGSGRVRVDFNHPLAGRDVEYSLHLEKEFNDKKEISEQLYSKYYERIPGTKKEYAEDKLTIILEGEAFKNLTKINEAIVKLADELGVKLEFKESNTSEKVIGEKTEETKNEKTKELPTEHVHGPNCDHEHAEHEHVHGENCNHEHLVHDLKLPQKAAPKSKVIDGDAVSREIDRPKSIHRIADELKGGAKKAGNFEVTRDASSTIQRPKKKQ